MQYVSRLFLFNRFPSLAALKIEHIDSLSITQQLASCFPHLPSLQTLDFDNAEMGNELFRVLAAALPHLSSSLKTLYLQDNNLGDQGMTALALVLPQLPLLEQLTLPVIASEMMDSSFYHKLSVNSVIFTL